MLQECGTCLRTINSRSYSIWCTGKCSNWHHAKCVNLSPTNLSFYINETKKTGGEKWLCNDCKSDLLENSDPIDLNLTLHGQMSNGAGTDIAPKPSTGLNELFMTHFGAFKDEIKASLGVVTNLIQSFETRLSSLEEDNKNLKLELAKLINNTSNIQSVQVQPISEHTVFSELEDRRYRSKNLMIFNHIESVAVSIEDKAKDDEEQVYQIIKGLGDYPIPLKVIRMGKTGDNPRPIKLVYDSPSIVKDILKNSKKIIAPLKINSDQTLSQRKHLINLRIELSNRLSNGEKDITIKYSYGIPIITKIKDIATNIKN